MAAARRCRRARFGATASWSSASAAIQPDISTIGMPGPGWAAPPARYSPVTSGDAVRRLERADPLAVARQAVDRPVQHAVAVVDVLRRQRRLVHDPLLEVRHLPGRLQLVEDDVGGTPAASASSRGAAAGTACGRARTAPRRPAGRSPGSVRGGGREVARRVRGRLALAVDEVELLVRVAREDEVVVQQVVVGLVQARGRARRRSRPARTRGASRTVPRRAALLRQQFAVRADAVRVRHHRGQLDHLAVVGLDAA